jgi:hypothetical protein
LRYFAIKGIPARGQFYQHFCCQSRPNFAQINFEAFNGNSIWQNCAKIWHSVQQVLTKLLLKISAEMLVKQSNIFCVIYFMLAPLCIAQIG